jgi:hypothetical protein
MLAFVRHMNFLAGTPLLAGEHRSGSLVAPPALTVGKTAPSLWLAGAAGLPFLRHETFAGWDNSLDRWQNSRFIVAGGAAGLVFCFAGWVSSLDFLCNKTLAGVDMTSTVGDTACSLWLVWTQALTNIVPGLDASQHTFINPGSSNQPVRTQGICPAAKQPSSSRRREDLC